MDGIHGDIEVCGIHGGIEVCGIHGGIEVCGGVHMVRMCTLVTLQGYILAHAPTTCIYIYIYRA